VNTTVSTPARTSGRLAVDTDSEREVLAVAAAIGPWAVRPKTATEQQFCALGPIPEAFLTGATAAGNTRLGSELGDLLALDAAHGRDALLAALGRATAFRRWRAEDVHSIRL
jgi:hypothetical protein